MLNKQEESKLEQENKMLISEIKMLEKESSKNAIEIDSLKEVDVVYVDKIKVIKETLIKELHILDSLPHSGIEKYFSDRYSSKDSVTFYPEEVAKKAAADLVSYDACKEISEQQENRINNFLIKDKAYEKQISIKDTIISKKDAIISNQDRIITNSKRPKIASYLGIMTQEATITNPNLYGKVMFNTKKINIGAQYNFKSTVLPAYNLILEYKIF
jgi:CRISPR/Cas system-associated protein endoribonuclease Cas2